MPRLLTAERQPVGVEGLEDVAVADRGLPDDDPAAGHRPVEAEVRHDRDRDGVAGELPALGEVASEDHDQLVSGTNGPFVVHCDKAIGVAVESEAEIGAGLTELLRRGPLDGSIHIRR